jgi:aminoglycoside phosphotransferase family enzyme
VGTTLFRVYREVAGDDVPEDVGRFYKAGRALVRAKLAIEHLREPRFRDTPLWHDRAQGYLALARGQLGLLA